MEPNEQLEHRAGLDPAHGGQLLTRSEIDDDLALVDYLTFVSYRENRRLSPEVTPERWKAVYGPRVEQMEARYKAERKVRGAA